MSGGRQFDPMAIAVVGMAGRFPGAEDVDAFWRLVRDGVEAISTGDSEPTTTDRAISEELDPDQRQAGGVLDGMDLFDAAFFDFNPREAELTDPQQRLLLECAWQALENAGCDPEQLDGVAGVFAGVGMSTYFLHNVFSAPERFRATPLLLMQIGADKDYAAARVSYKLNLRGPSFSVQSACSTGLVAVHLACQSLQDYQCDLALAGAATLLLPQQTGHASHEGGIYSPDGRCRPFDAAAAGTVASSGVGVLALRRLEDAHLDGARVLAVIRGSAINNDGNAKVGFTAPSVEGQVAVISEALAAAGVEPGSITSLEAHGTGTALGDPIEVAALARAFAADPRRGKSPRSGCALGSVKSNVGHADTAAGIAGLIKTVQALRHHRLPPSLGFVAPHPEIDFDSTPFFVNTELRDWPAGATPRRAGVSSFGIGGTNAHAVLEEAPPPPSSGVSRRAQLLLLSARDPEALEAVGDRLADHLRDLPRSGRLGPSSTDSAFADVAHTTRVGRRAFSHARALVCRGPEDALEALHSRDAERLIGGIRPAVERPLVFLFPGQGAQYIDMARGLYEDEPTFRRSFDRAALGFFDRGLEFDLRRVLYPETLPAGKGDPEAGLRETDRAQAALFAVELALSRLLAEWGLEPVAMAGHSLGEYVAAHLSGVFDFGTALTLVAARGRLMRRLPAGAMLSVEVREDELAERLARHPRLALAAANGPALQVVSGPVEAVEALAGELVAAGVKARRLQTSHAFHSSMMDPILGDFAAVVDGIELAEPRIPFLSSLTGRWIEASEATDPGYWVRHLRETVRFGDALSALFEKSGQLLLEVGPGRTLATLARRHDSFAPGQPVLGTLRGSGGPRGACEEDQAFLLRTLARLWLSGARIDWRGFVRHEERRIVELPTYPLRRQRYWLDPPEAAPEAAERQTTPNANTRATPRVPTAHPEHARPGLGTTFVAPRNAAEEKIAAIWSEALGLAEVGVFDDFFELGGHSLLATEICDRVRRELRREVSLSTLLETSTVASMAAVTGATLTEDAGGGLRVDGLRVDSVRVDGLRVEDLPDVIPDPTRRGEPFPLTDVQQAYWIGRNPAFDLGGVATHTYAEFDVAGVSLEALEHAWRRIIERHDMLRAIVLPSGQQQILEEVPPYEIELLDLIGKTPREARQELLALRERLSRQVLPSDLWPLFELRASRVRQGVYRLHFSFDLLIGDARSWDLLLWELTRRLRDPNAHFPSFEISFRDYVLACQKLEGLARFARDFAYWQARLPEFPGAPDLPLAVAASELGAPRFARLAHHLEAAAWAEVKRRAARYRLTPSVVLLAAYAEVLAAWSHTPRFVVNLTLFHRLPLHEEVEDLVGDFTSLTLLTVDGDAPGSFAIRAQRLQRQLWQDLDHRLVSGVRVLRELARRRGTTAQEMMMPVVFTSTLNVAEERGSSEDGRVGVGLGEDGLENDLVGPVTNAGQGLPGDDTREDLYGISQTPQVWIDHQVQERSGALYYNWDVVEGLFPEGVPQAMFRAFTHLVRRLAADERAFAQASPLRLPDCEFVARRQANATAAPAPDLLLHQPFHAQTARRSDAAAVISPSGILSYGALARRVRALALRLRARGARSNCLIAVTLHKGWEQVVAVLGVLEAGAAYLPVDPELPERRRFGLYQNGEVELVVTESRLSGELRFPFGLVVVEVDRLVPAAESGPLEPAQGVDDLAYVIFTSGSTGDPKGVMIEHRAARNTIADIHTRFAVGPEDRVLALSSLSFDLSVWDIFGLLSAGGALVLPAPAKERDPVDWWRLLAENRVSLWNSVPALMELLTEHSPALLSPPECFLRLVMLSGDRIAVTLPGRVRSILREARVVSLGGATEASIWSILHPVAERDSERPGIPYGKPLANQTFHVLGPRLEPLPVWVTGELFIGGLGLARGYWRKARETAARFLPSPETGERLYRTGDLGRYMADGALEFLGRKDFQVKIRGYRVELGEIEAALDRHPRVRESVVVMSPAIHTATPRALIAYYIAAGDPPAPETLRASLRENLPDYMVPARFLAVDRWPLSANGKLDRRALPDSAEQERSHDGTPLRREPESEIEKALAEICAELLGAEGLGADDDLFELGGDSLTAVRLTYRVRERLGVEISVRAFYDSPCVAGLAALVEGLRRDARAAAGAGEP